MSPRYKDQEWGDSGYDAVEQLIDNDPMELASWFRRTKGLLDRLLPAIETEGATVDSPLADLYVAAQSLLREWNDAVRVEADEDDF